MTAITTGATGEITSVPAVTNGHQLLKQGFGYQALMTSAFSSVVASIISLFLVNLIIWSSPDISLFLSSKFRFAVFIMIIFGLIFTSKNYIYAAIAAILGLIVGMVGWNELFQTRILTFGLPQLDTGLNSYTILFGGLIIPILYENIKQTFNENVTMPKADKSPMFKYFYWGACIRGSLIGFFMGLIPGISYLISSNVAERVEKRISRDNNLWRNLISAEGANNAGAISSLLPFLIFSLPILPSEAIIMGLFESNGYNVFTNNMLADWLIYSPILLVVLGMVNFLLSGYLYSPLVNFISFYQKQIYVLCFFVCCGLFLYTSITEYNLIVDTVLLITVILIQYVLKVQTITFIYVYFVSTYFFNEVSYMVQMFIL